MSHPTSQEIEELVDHIQPMRYSPIDDSLRRMREHIRQFEKEYQHSVQCGKVPRKIVPNDVWRPYLCWVRNVALGLAVVRYTPVYNCLEVDVCLTTEIPGHTPCSGTRMICALLLSEAYRCGGSLAIRFSEHIEDGHVPKAIQALAQHLHVKLHYAEKGFLAANEARQLYLALTNFSPAFRRYIATLADSGIVSLERACYIVHHGIWTGASLEALVLGSRCPQHLFNGSSSLEQYHLYMHDLQQAQAALLVSLLDHALTKRVRTDFTDHGQEYVLDLDDDVHRLETSFNPDVYATAYQGDEDLPLPWLEIAPNGQTTLPTGQHLFVLVRARRTSELMLYFRQDLEDASRLLVSAQQQPSYGRSNQVCILTTRDLLNLPAYDTFLQEAQSRGIGILVWPGTLASLETDVKQRLAYMRMLH